MSGIHATTLKRREISVRTPVAVPLCDSIAACGATLFRGRYLATGAVDGTLQVWRLPEPGVVPVVLLQARGLGTIVAVVDISAVWAPVDGTVLLVLTCEGSACTFLVPSGDFGGGAEADKDSGGAGARDAPELQPLVTQRVPCNITCAMVATVGCADGATRTGIVWGGADEQVATLVPGDCATRVLAPGWSVTLTGQPASLCAVPQHDGSQPVIVAALHNGTVASLSFDGLPLEVRPATALGAGSVAASPVHMSAGAGVLPPALSDARDGRGEGAAFKAVAGDASVGSGAGAGSGAGSYTHHRKHASSSLQASSLVLCGRFAHTTPLPRDASGFSGSPTTVTLAATPPIDAFTAKAPPAHGAATPVPEPGHALDSVKPSLVVATQAGQLIIWRPPPFFGGGGGPDVLLSSMRVIAKRSLSSMIVALDQITLPNGLPAVVACDMHGTVFTTNRSHRSVTFRVNKDVQAFWCGALSSGNLLFVFVTVERQMLLVQLHPSELDPDSPSLPDALAAAGILPRLRTPLPAGVGPGPDSAPATSSGAATRAVQLVKWLAARKAHAAAEALQSCRHSLAPTAAPT